MWYIHIYINQHISLASPRKMQGFQSDDIFHIRLRRFDMIRWRIICEPGKNIGWLITLWKTIWLRDFHRDFHG